MRIGFVNIVNPSDVQWFPSLAFGSLKAYLHRHFGDAVVMERSDPWELYKYDVAAISCLSQNYNIAQSLARHAKTNNPNVVVVLGGTHITCVPETMTQDFDFGVIGEGEQTFVELIEYLMSGRKEEKLFTINGLALWYNGGLLFAPSRALIDPIDSLPMPFREPISQQYLFTSRGCPYKCTFCSSSAFWKTTRFHSAKWVADEIQHLMGMGYSHLPFLDDLFVVNRKRFIETIEEIKRRHLDAAGFTTSFSVRANLVDDELCALIKGFPSVKSTFFGIESGSDRILKLMGKNVTVAKNQEALDRLFEIGLPPSVSLIVGWPSETEEEIRATCSFVQKNVKEKKVRWDNPIAILTPLPNTPVWDDAVKAGLLPSDLRDFNWGRLGPFGGYTASQLSGIEEWIYMRRQNGSLYINEDTVPQERLYDILREHDAKVRQLAGV
jgi:radical SAM superfamily enzyme YgiQ (UPF0313 family)